MSGRQRNASLLMGLYRPGQYLATNRRAQGNQETFLNENILLSFDISLTTNRKDGLQPIAVIAGIGYY